MVGQMRGELKSIEVADELLEEHDKTEEEPDEKAKPVSNGT